MDGILPRQSRWQRKDNWVSIGPCIWQDVPRPAWPAHLSLNKYLAAEGIPYDVMLTEIAMCAEAGKPVIWRKACNQSGGQQQEGQKQSCARYLASHSILQMSVAAQGMCRRCGSQSGMRDFEREGPFPVCIIVVVKLSCTTEAGPAIGAGVQLCNRVCGMV